MILHLCRIIFFFATYWDSFSYPKKQQCVEYSEDPNDKYTTCDFENRKISANLQIIRVSEWVTGGYGFADSMADLQISVQKSAFLRLKRRFCIVIQAGRTA